LPAASATLAARSAIRRVKGRLEPGGALTLSGQRLAFLAKSLSLVVVVASYVRDVDEAIEEVAETVGLEEEDDSIRRARLVQTATLVAEKADMRVVLLLDVLAAGVQGGDLLTQLLGLGELALVVRLLGVVVRLQLSKDRLG